VFGDEVSISSSFHSRVIHEEKGHLVAREIVSGVRV
jgi:hypothetical protein